MALIKDASALVNASVVNNQIKWYCNTTTILILIRIHPSILK